MRKKGLDVLAFVAATFPEECSGRAADSSAEGADVKELDDKEQKMLLEAIILETPKWCRLQKKTRAYLAISKSASRRFSRRNDSTRHRLQEAGGKLKIHSGANVVDIPTGYAHDVSIIEKAVVAHKR